MPIYSYECDEHGRYETFMPMAECNNGKCPKCEKVGQRKYDSYHVYMDFTPGWDHSLNMYVNTKRQRDDVLREKGWTRYKD